MNGNKKSIKIKAKAFKISNNLPSITTQVAICPIPFHYDPYIGCPHNCLYCFARDNTNFRRRKSGLDFSQIGINSVRFFYKGIHNLLSKPLDNTNALSVFLHRRVPIKIGANSDPFPEIEKENKVTFKTLKILQALDYPIQVQTKRPDIFLTYANEFRDYTNLCLSVTCILKDSLCKLIEPNVPVTSERFKSISKLTDMGFNVLVKSQPLIYPILNDNLPYIIEESSQAGCWGVNTEGLKLRIVAGKQEKSHYIKLGRILGIPDIYEFYKKELKTSSDYELNISKKVAYTKLARELCHKYNLTYLVADNQGECIKLSDSDECCGTEKLHDYTKFSYNFRTKIFTGKSWRELENGLENALYTGRNITTPITLKQLVHRKLK